MNSLRYSLDEISTYVDSYNKMKIEGEQIISNSIYQIYINENGSSVPLMDVSFT